MPTIYLAKNEATEEKDIRYWVLPIQVSFREPLGRDITTCCPDFYRGFREWHLFYAALWDQQHQKERPRMLMRCTSERSMFDLPEEWRQYGGGGAVPIAHCPFCGDKIRFQTVMTVTEKSETKTETHTYDQHWYEEVLDPSKYLPDGRLRSYSCSGLL